MWTFIARRLIQSVIVLVGVTLISFVSLQIGGDPTYLFVSERASAEEIAMVRHALGFDRPLHVQYLTYVWNVLHGEFGNSLSYRQPAMQIVLGSLPATIELTLAAMLFAILLAIPFGVFAALYRGTRARRRDHDARHVRAVDPELLARDHDDPVLRPLPVVVPDLGPRAVPAAAPPGGLAHGLRQPAHALYHLAMPAVAVGFYSLSRNARLVRSSMLEVLGQDFVRTARSKGISERAVVVNHALRNAWLPVVTMIGLEFGFLLGGVVVIETVFSWPGIGRLVFNAINQRDIPVVQAAVIVLSLIFVALNLIVDLVYARIDPRVKL